MRIDSLKQLSMPEMANRGRQLQKKDEARAVNSDCFVNLQHQRATQGAPQSQASGNNIAEQPLDLHDEDLLLEMCASEEENEAGDANAGGVQSSTTKNKVKKKAKPIWFNKVKGAVNILASGSSLYGDSSGDATNTEGENELQPMLLNKKPKKPASTGTFLLLHLRLPRLRCVILLFERKKLLLVSFHKKKRR
ncbi:unnamed protein product [Amoebophrya sp. A25]|nr:unnamed protein product [Amoebophrya sp. A25]|eukprot:GSA25T00013828001.1